MLKRTRLPERFRLVIAGLFLTVGTAIAGEIGTIDVFYNSTAPSPCPANLSAACAANNTVGVLDGPVFVFVNASGTAITNGVFTIVGEDFFDVGTIDANSSVTVIPGVSNDGQDHGADNFFTVTGDIFDSSDEYSSLNSTELEFTGQQGGTAIQSVDLCDMISAPVFTPACTAAPSNDGTVTHPPINFLGGPGNNDGPCNNCFGPAVVADLDTVETASAPEPSSFSLLGASLIGLVAGGVRSALRRRKA